MSKSGPHKLYLNFNCTEKILIFIERGIVMVDDNKVLFAINEVLSSESHMDALLTFVEYSEILNSCSFAFFSDEFGKLMPEYLKCKEVGDFMIHNLSSKRRIFVLDKDTCSEMLECGESYFKIDTCIALDTQAVSYIEKIFDNKVTSVPDEYKSFVDILLGEDVNYDYSLYMIENINKLNTQKARIETYKNLMACERFKFLDIQKYRLNGTIFCTKTEEELLSIVDQRFYFMNNMVHTNEGKPLWDKYYAIYAILLKTCSIEFSTKKGIKYKILGLLDFVNNELGFFCERELAVCYLYLKHNTCMARFFKKIQPNSKDILKNLKGMAWDLAHLRHLEHNMAIIRPENVRYSLYSLMTFDNGLKDVVNAFPIDRFAINKGALIPVFSTPLYDLISEVDVKENFASNKTQRRQVFENLDIEKKILELESGLISIIESKNTLICK
jgi:hypothetical protein